MTDQQQLALLKQGVTQWNAWRKVNPCTPIDLSGALLSFATLSFADLSGANLSGANLNGANLNGATVTIEQLATVTSLVGATLPDGTKRP